MDAVPTGPMPMEDEAVTAPQRPCGGYWLPLGLIVGLLLGVAAGYLLPRSGTPTPGNDSAEAGFARDMTTHHAQAVEMAMLAYTQASDPEVRIIARDIALTQQGQIGMMQSWLQEWNLDPTGTQAAMAWMPDGRDSLRNGLMPGMATPEELAQLRAAIGAEQDRLFLRLMIQHHLGGIHMAQEIIKVSAEEHVVELAQNAVNGQQRELTDMQALLQRVDKVP